MIKIKLNIFIIGLITVFILSECVSAQGLDINGNASFSYATSASSTKNNTVQELNETFTQNYSLNIKNDLTSKGNVRSAVRYSIDNDIKAKKEKTDLSVDLSYDKISCALGLTDDTNSDFDMGVINMKTNNFRFSINPEVLPKFSLNYSSSIRGSELTTTSDNDVNVQFSKNFKIQDSDISSSVSFDDKSTNSAESPTVKQTTDNRFNLGYSTKLLNNKLSLNSGYRLGNNYDVGTSVNNLTESGDASIGFSLLENLILNGDWSKNNDFSSSTGKKNVTMSNGFRVAFTPIKNLSIASSVKFSETQNEDAIKSDKTRDLSVRLPPLLESINLGYTYSSNETKNTVTANDAVDLTFSPPSMPISNFSSSARYGFGKKHSIENMNASETENFGFSLSGQPIEKLSCAYNYSLDKNNSNVLDDNKDSISNSVTLGYGMTIVEDLVSTFSSSYDHTQNISSTASSDKTESAYRVSLDYSLGETMVNFAGSVTRSFDETGTHLSRRTDFGPGISTIFKGIPLSAKLSVGTDSKDGELTSTNNTNYSLNASYPVGNIGAGSLSYTATQQENLSNPSANSNEENITINMSFVF